VNVAMAADFAVFIRKNEPQGVTVSVGGEIGEVGGKNSDVHELRAYMNGFNKKLKERGASLVGSKGLGGGVARRPRAGAAGATRGKPAREPRAARQVGRSSPWIQSQVWR